MDSTKAVPSAFVAPEKQQFFVSVFDHSYYSFRQTGNCVSYTMMDELSNSTRHRV